VFEFEAGREPGRVPKEARMRGLFAIYLSGILMTIAYFAAIGLSHH